MKLDVGLLWPESATRVESVVRVWGMAGGRRVMGYDEHVWRGLPPQPDADREALPWLTLAGAGNRLKLALDLAEPVEALPGVVVERALFQAWIGDDLTIRARWLLQKWPATGVDVTLPAGAANLAVAADGRRVTLLQPVAGGADGVRVVRVPLPPAESRTGRGYTTLDVRYQMPPRESRGELTLVPPLLAAAYRGPARWQIFAPPDTVPIGLGGDVQFETGWAWRGGLAMPTAGAATAELELWFKAGADADADTEASAVPGAADAEAVTGRQPTPGPLQLAMIPRAAWVSGCSLAALLLVLGLSRVRPSVLGPLVGGRG